MTSLSININTDNLMKALLKTPDLLANNMSNAVQRSSFEMARSARRHIREGPTAFTTLLLSTVNSQVSPYEAIVAPTVNYASIVEEGTAGGGKMPDREVIQDWINVRNIEPNDPFMDDRDLSFLIARSIGRKGTPPQPYLQPAFDDNVRRTEKRLNRAITAALEGKKK